MMLDQEVGDVQKGLFPYQGYFDSFSLYQLMSSSISAHDFSIDPPSHERVANFSYFIQPKKTLYMAKF
jgi:hypothetical protein